MRAKLELKKPERKRPLGIILSRVYGSVTDNNGFWIA
jgi:hypothetical protein